MRRPTNLQRSCRICHAIISFIFHGHGGDQHCSNDICPDPIGLQHIRHERPEASIVDARHKKRKASADQPKIRPHAYEGLCFYCRVIFWLMRFLELVRRLHLCQVDGERRGVEEVDIQMWIQVGLLHIGEDSDFMR